MNWARLAKCSNRERCPDRIVTTDPILRCVGPARSQRQSRGRRSDGTPKVCRTAARSLPDRISQSTPVSSGVAGCSRCLRVRVLNRLRKRRCAHRKAGSWNSGSCKSVSVLSVLVEVSVPHLPSAGGHAVRIRVLADRLVDDPVMVAASLRLGTTTVRDDHPGWLSIGCLLAMISPRREPLLSRSGVWPVGGILNMDDGEGGTGRRMLLGHAGHLRRLRGVVSTKPVTPAATSPIRATATREGGRHRCMRACGRSSSIAVESSHNEPRP